MKITSINISPNQSWSAVSAANPLRAKVKLNSEDTAVETILNDEDCQKLVDLIQHVIADAAKRNVDDFVDHIRSLPHEEAKALT